MGQNRNARDVAPYPCDEFICRLQGQFVMVDDQGGSVTAGKGNGVVFRNGAPMSWKQQGYLKKFFVTYLDPNGPVPQIATEQEAVIVWMPMRN